MKRRLGEEFELYICFFFFVSKGVGKGRCLPVEMLCHILKIKFKEKESIHNSFHIQRAFLKCGLCLKAHSHQE